MKKLYTLSLAFVLLMSMNAYAQAVKHVFEEYGKVEATQNAPYKNTIAKDSYGNTYICGATWDIPNANYDAFLQKIDKKGNTLWTQTFGGASLDFFTNIFILHDTAIYVTGLTTNTSADLLTVKYTSAGVERWHNSFDGAYHSYDCGGDLIANDSGAVFVTGGSFNSNLLFSDMVVLKLANSNGQILLSNFWDNPTYHLNDVANKITFDSKYIFIAGVTGSATNVYHYATVKFYKNNLSYGGVSISTATNSTTVDEVKDLKEDATGIYLVGKTKTATSGYNMCLIKLDTSLNTVFAVNFDGGNNLNDEFNGIVLDNSGNIFCTGYASITSSNKKYVTMKFNSSGTTQWTKYYSDTLSGDSEATGIAIDNAQNVYVTGFSQSAINQLNFHTIKYANLTGAELWHIESDGIYHLNDTPSNVIVDDFQDIIVSGQSQLPNGKYEYKTCKYSEHDIITPTDYSGEAPSSNFMYYENRGQLVDISNSPISEIRYYTNNTTPGMYFKDYSFSYVFSKVDTIATTRDTLQRIDISFKNSQDNTKIYPLEEQNNYLSYFISQCQQGITEIKGNQRLVIPNLYPNIDLMYYSNSKGFKYYFIVKPSADPRDIQILIDGASSVVLNTTANNLTINSTIGNVKWDKIKAYNLDASNNVIPLTDSVPVWQYSGSDYHFHVGAYDLTKALVIEVKSPDTATTGCINCPAYSSYFGGTNNDFAYDITYDTHNNIYFAGSTSSSNTVTNGFPITTGVYDSTYNGNEDAFITKLDVNYHNMFTTYIGGNGGDVAYGIAHTNIGNKVYICGTIESDSTSRPTVSAGGSSYVNSIGGGVSPGGGYISRLSDDGINMDWFSYWGGNASGSCNKLKCDATGNVFMVGYTSNSYSGSCTPSGAFPICNPGGGAFMQYQFNYGLLWYDGFIAKFDNTTHLLWSTFVGGGGDDWCENLAIDDAHSKLYVVGNTTSNAATTTCVGYTTDFPMCNSIGGFSQPNMNGNSDGFIMRFTLGGVMEYSTMYGGNNDDGITGVAINTGGDGIYVTGYTNSPTNFPSILYSGSMFHQSFVGGYYDNFISRFGFTMNREWSTFIGGNSAEAPEAFSETGPKVTVGTNNYAYIYGNTRTGSNPAGTIGVVNNNYYYNQSTHGDAGGTVSNTDCYLMGFDPGAHQIWSSYWGGKGAHYDGVGLYDGDIVGSIVATPNNRLYICGGTYSNVNFPLNCPTTGAPYSQTNTSAPSYSDAFVANVIQGGTSGITEQANKPINCLIYPNPSSGEFTLELDLKTNDKVTIEVYNLLGEKVLEQKVNGMTGKNKYQIDLTKTTDGIYFVTTHFGNESLFAKIIKN